MLYCIYVYYVIRTVVCFGEMYVCVFACVRVCVRCEFLDAVLCIYALNGLFGINITPWL